MNLVASKKELAKKAYEIMKGNKFGKISDTQLRNFVEAAKNADNFEEFRIFLKYQESRDKGVEDFFSKSDVLKYLEEEFEKESFEKSRELIAYFFGNLARCKKAGGKNDSSKQN